GLARRFPQSPRKSRGAAKSKCWPPCVCDATGSAHRLVTTVAPGQAKARKGVISVMTAQLLIYETVVPLSASQHRGCSVEVGGNYEFSSKTNSVPLMAIEFRAAASEYAIVFVGTKDNVMPAVILGLRDNENLYLSRDHKWDAKYIPAFVRRYP